MKPTPKQMKIRGLRKYKKNSFDLVTVCLKISGCSEYTNRQNKPLSRGERAYRVYSYCALLIMVSIPVTQAISVYKFWGDFRMVATNIAVFLSSVGHLGLITVPVFQRDKYKTFFIGRRALINPKRDRKKLGEKYTPPGTLERICFTFPALNIGLGMIVVISWLFVPLLKTDEKSPFMFESWYPFDTSKSPLFEIRHVYEGVAAILYFVSGCTSSLLMYGFGRDLCKSLECVSTMINNVGLTRHKSISEGDDPNRNQIQDGGKGPDEATIRTKEITSRHLRLNLDVETFDCHVASRSSLNKTVQNKHVGRRARACIRNDPASSSIDSCLPQVENPEIFTVCARNSPSPGIKREDNVAPRTTTLLVGGNNNDVTIPNDVGDVDVGNAGPESSVGGTTSKETQRDREMIERSQLSALVECIKEHQKVLRCGRDLNELYSRAFLVQIFVCYSIISLYAFMAALESRPMMIVQYAFSCLANILKLLLFCWVGEKLRISSKKVGYAAYCTDWPDRSKSFKFYIQMIIMRAQVPLSLTSGMFLSFGMSLGTFRKTVNASYSLFRALQSVNKTKH